LSSDADASPPRWTERNPNITAWQSWMFVFFGNYRWCRRLLGGHWERWYIAQFDIVVWMDTDRCSVASGTMPSRCSGAPLECEDYP
jgi:hypothetical protein